MELNALKEILPICAANGVLSIKSGNLEIHFKPDLPQKVSVTTPDGKTISTESVKPIETVKSADAPIPSSGLEEEQGMTYDQVLHWSTTDDSPSVPGTNDSPINDTPIEESKIESGPAVAAKVSG